ncbi:MAG: hypothetical protein GW778_01175 [Alphaproteobacteria bacterium]|nr:hypothetical protein [Alphaproteobacteria bacterium]
MSKLSKTFAFESRADIEKLGIDIAAIITNMIANRDPSDLKPIIISLQSPENAGKSAVWDIVREQLLDKGGIFINKLSSSSEKHGRCYETWEGEINNQSVRFLACNVGFLVYEWMSRLKYEHFLKFLNNKASNDKAPLNYDVIILSKSDCSFIDPSLHDLTIKINYLSPYKPGSWRREVSIETDSNSAFAKLYE